MYPLRFQPIFKDYIWGGERLEPILGKKTGPGIWAESWEIVDHAENQSVVRDGPWQGMTLRQLLESNGSDVLGARVFAELSNENLPTNLRNRFPLLLKFLDASRVLSVQVHPDDKMGATLSPPDLGKTEAWYVVDALPDAEIFAGLKPGVTREKLQLAIQNGNTESLLHRFTPQAGDCVFIRAGTVHAIGAGLLVCEIQQASNTTFRLFDWNRVGNDGEPRALHIEKGLDAIDFEHGPIQPISYSESDSNVNLISCDKFVLNRLRLSEPTQVGEAGRFSILAVIDGELSLQDDPCQAPMVRGQTALLPACCGPIACDVKKTATILEIHLPDSA